MLEPDTSPGEPAPQRLGALHLMTHGPFSAFFFGSLTVSTGVWFYNLAAAVVIFQLTDSALLVGMLSVMQFAGPMFLLPWTGALSDRINRRRMLLVGIVISAVGAVVLAVWTLVVGVEGLPGSAPILGAAALIGVGFSVIVPASQAVLPALVEPEDLADAVALHAMTFNVGRAAGPALGAATLATFGSVFAFVFAAVAWLTFLVLTFVGIRPRPGRSFDAVTYGGSGSAREGLRYVLARRPLLLLLIAVAAVGFGMDPIITLTPPLAEVLDGGEALVGVLAAAFGIGAVGAIVLVNPVRRWLGLRNLGRVGLGILGGGLVGLALSPTPQFATAALLFGGVGLLLATTSLTTQLHARTDEAMRGRVMALWGLAYLGSRPLAALFNGGLAEQFGPRPAIVIAGALSLLAIAALPEGTDRPTESAGG